MEEVHSKIMIKKCPTIVNTQTSNVHRVCIVLFFSNKFYYGGLQIFSLHFLVLPSILKKWEFKFLWSICLHFICCGLLQKYTMLIYLGALILYDFERFKKPPNMTFSKFSSWRICILQFLLKYHCFQI